MNPQKNSPVNLGSTDAAFVLTIHTEELFSEPSITGHLAFFINNGKNQPMCKKFFFLAFDDAICGDKQAQVFWIEAVKSNSATIFPARKCTDYNQFEARKCDENFPVGHMNLHTPTNMTGKYFLNTFDTSPYSRSLAEP